MLSLTTTVAHAQTSGIGAPPGRLVDYDRARHAWSDPSPNAETPASVTRHLHALPAAAGERPAYVLAGRSIGEICVGRLPDVQFKLEEVVSDVRCR